MTPFRTLSSKKSTTPSLYRLKFSENSTGSPSRRVRDLCRPCQDGRPKRLRLSVRLSHRTGKLGIYPRQSEAKHREHPAYTEVKPTPFPESFRPGGTKNCPPKVDKGVAKPHWKRKRILKNTPEGLPLQPLTADAFSYSKANAFIIKCRFRSVGSLRPLLANPGSTACGSSRQAPF